MAAKAVTIAAATNGRADSAEMSQNSRLYTAAVKATAPARHKTRADEIGGPLNNTAPLPGAGALCSGRQRGSIEKRHQAFYSGGKSFQGIVPSDETQIST